MDSDSLSGRPLVPCASDTGFRRDGFCSKHAADAGAHHVCLDPLPADFCTATRQPDWCVPDAPWCVCEWAFARYVEETKQCPQVKCDATTQVSVTGAARECLRRQCSAA